jgi:hypothetical protein
VDGGANAVFGLMAMILSQNHGHIFWLISRDAKWHNIEQTKNIPES